MRIHIITLTVWSSLLRSGPSDKVRCGWFSTSGPSRWSSHPRGAPKLSQIQIDSVNAAWCTDVKRQMETESGRKPGQWRSFYEMVSYSHWSGGIASLLQGSPELEAIPFVKLQVAVASCLECKLSTWNLQDLLKRYHPDSMARISRKTNKAGCKREPSCSPQGPFLKKPGMPWRSGSVSGWISQMPWCFLKSLYKFCEHVVEGHSIGWYFGWSDLLYWARSISAFASQITLHEPWAQSQQDYDFTMLHCSSMFYLFTFPLHNCGKWWNMYIAVGRATGSESIQYKYIYI